MVDTVTKFCKTSTVGDYITRFNLNVFDKINLVTFRGAIKKLYDGEKSRGITYKRTILEILHRYFFPELYVIRHIKNLIGPVLLYKLSDPSGRYPHIIYIFGDEHSSHTTCSPGEGVKNIADFIIDCTKTLPVFIDIFIETSYRSKDAPIDDSKSAWGENSYIQQIKRKFSKECFDYLKTSCNLETSRIHYTDMRSYITTTSQNIMTNIIRYIKNWGGQSNTDRARRIRYMKNNVHLLKMYFSSKETAQKLFVTDNIRDRIQKQIANIPSKIIREYLTKYFNDKISSTHFIDIDFDKLMKKSDDNIRNTIANFKDKVLNPYRLALMDVYLLARLFRTFRDVKGKYSLPAYNSIIYVGAKHAMTYNKILTDIGFTSEEYISMGCHFQCISINKVEQPIFSERFSKK